MRQCEQCGADFDGKRSDAIFCGRSCANGAYNRRRNGKPAPARKPRDVTRGTRSVSILAPAGGRDTSHEERLALIERNRATLAARGDVAALAEYDEAIAMEERIGAA